MSDLIFDLTHYAGKTIASVQICGDAKHYERYKEDCEGLEYAVVTFTDDTAIQFSFWASEMGGLCVDNEE